MDSNALSPAYSLCTTHGDLTDQEWNLPSNLMATYSGGGRMGRPIVHAKRDIVDAILYVGLWDVDGGRYLTAIRRGARCIDTVCAGQEMVCGKRSVIVFENLYGKLTVANQNLQPG